MQRKWLAAAAISGFLVVALGAFGAHALKAVLSPDDLAIWQTAVQYQMFHTLALMGVAILNGSPSRRLLSWSGWMFGLGIVIFSGSLYTMVLTDQHWLGAITPIGGVAFLAGWSILVFAAMNTRRKL